MTVKHPTATEICQWVVIMILALLILGTSTPARSAPLLTGTSWGLRDIIRELEPAVVWIVAQVDTDEWSQGTGFIIDENGYLLTSAHVVDGAREIIVGWPDRYERSEVPAEIIAVNIELDLALLKIEGAHLPILPVDMSIQPFLGDAVITLGYPAGEELGLGGMSVTRGIISSFRSDEDGDVRAIQTDAAITLGCSGGPLFDLDTGTVVGVVQGKGMFLLEGFNFAVPVGHVFEFAGSPPELGIRTAVAALDSADPDNYSHPVMRSLEAYSAGLHASGQADWGEALSHFLLANRLDSEDPLAAYSTAESYAALQRPRLALHWLQRAFELGFSDFDNALDGQGFESVRNDDRFIELVENF